MTSYTFDESEVTFDYAEPPNRILKHLTACLNPKKGLALLEPEDRVLVLGTSSQASVHTYGARDEWLAPYDSSA